MKTLTEKNYIQIIENHFKNNHIVFCAISTNLKCANCLSTQTNIEKFSNKHKNHNLVFYYIEYSKYDILQNYYQLNNMLEYPKIIVFYGNWENKEFIEGIITLEELEEIFYNGDVKPLSL